MAKAKLDRYYTLQWIPESTPRKVLVHKWEEFGDAPFETYEVYPDGKMAPGSCSCPAWRACKHIRAVLEALKDGKLEEAWKWKWIEDKGPPATLQAVPASDIGELL